MGTRMMRVDWPAPATLHIHSDVTDPRASQVRQSFDGAVQILVGADVAVRVWLQDASHPVSARVGEIHDGATAIEFDDSTSADDDDTVLSAEGVAAVQGESRDSLTRTGNDVDDTIIGQPALGVALSGLDDETILGQRPLIGVGLDDPDASADTIIGPGRSRAGSLSVASAPAAPPAAGRPAPPVLPPPLPAIPGLSASAHVDAGTSPTGIRRTRVEPPETSGETEGTMSVSFPDGRVVALDRPVYVGRSPKSPRITSGLVPELVAVVSPRREVSSTHLEIQQEGRAVVVRDLGSTNGTRVSMPGVATSVLSPGASRVVATGTLLDLGDDVVLEVVATTGMARTGAPSGGVPW